MKSPKRHPRLGDHKVVCDRSGRTIMASEARQEWNGLIVDKRYWEPRHPQEFVRGVKDDQAVRYTRVPGDFDVAQDTTTGAGTTSGNGITFLSSDLGSKLHVSRVSVTITDSGFSNYKNQLDVQVSDDNVTFVNAGADPVDFEGAVSGSAKTIPVGVDGRYVRIRGTFPQGQSVDFTGTMTVFGGARNTTTSGDL